MLRRLLAHLIAKDACLALLNAGNNNAATALINGGTNTANTLMGINTDRVKIMSFILSGTLAAFAGLITLAFLNTVPPTAGTGIELDVIAAVVIGGTALAGGAGSILGTFLGAAIMSTVRDGLVLLGISAYWQQAAIGLVIVIAVTVDVLSTRRRHAN